jgi:ribosomal protein L11 methyltransferase
MSYLVLRFDAVVGDTERWADALLEAGALSVDYADARAGMADETPLYGEPDTIAAAWPTTRLTALFDATIDVAAALAQASARLGRLPSPHTLEPVAEGDWVRATQAQFGPIHASNRVWIIPTWCDPLDAGAINLRIDPGLAFGTGSHATTRLCLRWLDAHLQRGASLLDYGCGSGILAIAAAKLGAGAITGVDVDAQALGASRANARANAVNACFGLPEALRPGTFDVIVANILANPLQLLAPLLAGRVSAHGVIVLSGILESQAPLVTAAYARWFNIAIWGRDDRWVALAGSRKREHG